MTQAQIKCTLRFSDILVIYLMNKSEEIWVKPEVEDLGSAEELIKSINIVGGGDAQYSVLLPS